MSEKTSLDFILNPTEPCVAGLLDLHKVTLLPPPPLSLALSLGFPVQPRRVDEKRFVTIRPKAPLVAVSSPVVSTDGESAADEEEDDDDDDDDSDQHTPATPKPKRKKSSKKKTAMCKEPGCASLAVSRRSCVRHGVRSLHRICSTNIVVQNVLMLFSIGRFSVRRGWLPERSQAEEPLLSARRLNNLLG
jgi:hypothetical protein